MTHGVVEAFVLDNILSHASLMAGPMSEWIIQRRIEMPSNISGPPPDFLDSAKAALELVRELGQSDGFAIDLPLDQFFTLRDVTLANILEAAGPVSDSAAGVISLLSELILDLKDDMMFADVATWQPESTLTYAQRQARRKDLLAE